MSNLDDQTMNKPVTDKEWLEFQLLTAVHNLKAVAPDHYLVTTIEYALQSRPSWLKRQAE